MTQQCEIKILKLLTIGTDMNRVKALEVSWNLVITVSSLSVCSDYYCDKSFSCYRTAHKACYRYILLINRSSASANQSQKGK